MIAIAYRCKVAFTGFLVQGVELLMQYTQALSSLLLRRLNLMKVLVLINCRSSLSVIMVSLSYH